MTPKQLLAKEYYARNKEKVKARVAAWAESNKEIVRQNHADWVLRNKDRWVEIQKKYRSKPEVKVESTKRTAAWREKNRERAREIDREHAARNPDKIRRKSSLRRASERRAVPCWYGELDALVAAEAADLAIRRQKVTNFAWHIDHVIPLRGKTVCGLHVWNNLAVLPAAVNVRKAAKFDETALDTNVLDALGSR